MVTHRQVVITAESARPFGVSAIALIVALYGIFTALLGLLELTTGITSGIWGTSRGAGFEFLGWPAGLIIGAAYIAAGVGLWNLRRWAWWLASLGGIVGFVLAALGYVLAAGSVIGMFIWGGLLAYLFVVRGNFGVMHGVPQASSGG
jgi:hypothetical protein